MPEYRPCIVTETVYPPHGPCGIIEQIKRKALFHRWIKRTIINFKIEPYMGENFAIRPYNTNGEYLIGIVEFEDGTIHEYLPEKIQFKDGKAEKNSKNKQDDWNKVTEDTDSYPEAYENILFKTRDGRIYYGCCDTECEWEIELENEISHKIKDVIAWRKL